MKIIKIHIENFGKLSNYDVDLSEGITTIYEENGFGKSTLAAFIMSMFYGFDKKKVTYADNKYEIYNPWQGGVFGGSLCFECQRGRYRIERVFNKRKSEFKLYNTDKGQESKDYYENIGEELFGIDIEAFVKSVYIPQKDMQDGMPLSIMTRLNNSSADEGDINSFNRAVTALDNERKKYKLDRGQGGMCWDAEENYRLTNNKIESFSDEILSLPTFEGRIIEIDKEIEKSNKDEKIQSDKIKQLEKEAAQYKIALNNYNKYKGDLEKLTGLEKEITDIKDFFKVAPQPTEKEISDAYEDYYEYKNLKDTKEDKLSDEDSQTLAQYREFFSGGYPQKTEISIARVAAVNYNTAIGQEQIIRNNISRIKYEKEIKNQSHKKGKPQVGLLLAVVSLVLLILSVVIALLSENPLLGIIMSVVFGCSLIGGILYYFGNKNRNQLPIETQSPEEIQYLKELEKIQTEINKNNKITDNFRKKYNVNDTDFLTGLMELEGKIMNYESLIQKEEGLQKKAEEHNEKVKSAKAKFWGFVSRYYTVQSDLQLKEYLDDLKLKCNTLANKQERYEIGKKELQEFIIDNSVDTASSPVGSNYKDLQEQAENLIKEIREKNDGLKEERRKLQTKIEELRTKQQELIVLNGLADKYKEDFETYEYRYNIIKKTIDSLGKAKENLSLRYLEPIKNGFAKYSTLLTKSGLGEFVIDPNFNVSLFELGQQRRAAAFSKGYRSIIDMCLRFAMADAIFDKEKPVIILDDPFANLDNEKLKLAKEFLKNISKDMQIIYFVCHESRIIE